MINQQCQEFSAYVLQRVLPQILSVYRGDETEIQKALTQLATVIPNLDVASFKNIGANEKVWSALALQISRHFASQYEPGALRTAV